MKEVLSSKQKDKRSLLMFKSALQHRLSKFTANDIQHFNTRVRIFIKIILSHYLKINVQQVKNPSRVDQPNPLIIAPVSDTSFSEMLPELQPLYINLEEVFTKLNICTNSVDNAPRVFIKNITPAQLKQKLKDEKEYKKTRNKHFFELQNLTINLYSYDPEDKTQKNFKLLSKVPNRNKVLKEENLYDPACLFNQKTFFINPENVRGLTAVVTRYNAFMTGLLQDITLYIKATPEVCKIPSLDPNMFDSWFVNKSYPKSMSAKFVKLSDRLYEDKDYLLYKNTTSKLIKGFTDWTEADCWALEVKYQCAKIQAWAPNGGLPINFMFIVNAIKKHLEATKQTDVLYRFTNAISIWVQKSFFLNLTYAKYHLALAKKKEESQRGKSKSIRRVERWRSLMELIQQPTLAEFYQCIEKKPVNITTKNGLYTSAQKGLLKKLKNVSWKYMSPKSADSYKNKCKLKEPLNLRGKCLGYFYQERQPFPRILSGTRIHLWQKRLYKYKYLSTIGRQNFVMWPYLITKVKFDTLKISSFYTTLNYYVSILPNKNLRIVLPLDHLKRVLWQKTIKNLLTCSLLRRQLLEKTSNFCTLYQNLKETLYGKQNKYLSRLGAYELFFQKLRSKYEQRRQDHQQFINFFKLYNLYFFFFLINSKNIIQMYLYILLNLWLRFFYIVLNNNGSNNLVNVLFFESKTGLNSSNYNTEIEVKLISAYAGKFLKEVLLTIPCLIKGQVKQLYLTLFKTNLKILYFFLCQKKIFVTKNQVDMNLLDIFFFKSYKCQSVYNPHKNMLKFLLEHHKEYFLLKKQKRMRLFKKKIVKRNQDSTYRLMFRINSKKQFKKISNVFNWDKRW